MGAPLSSSWQHVYPYSDYTYPYQTSGVSSSQQSVAVGTAYRNGHRAAVNHEDSSQPPPPGHAPSQQQHAESYPGAYSQRYHDSGYYAHEAPRDSYEAYVHQQPYSFFSHSQYPYSSGEYRHHPHTAYSGHATQSWPTEQRLQKQEEDRPPSSATYSSPSISKSDNLGKPAPPGKEKPPESLRKEQLLADLSRTTKSPKIGKSSLPRELPDSVESARINDLSARVGGHGGSAGRMRAGDTGHEPRKHEDRTSDLPQAAESEGHVAVKSESMGPVSLASSAAPSLTDISNETSNDVPNPSPASVTGSEHNVAVARSEEPKDASTAPPPTTTPGVAKMSTSAVSSEDSLSELSDVPDSEISSSSASDSSADDEEDESDSSSEDNIKVEDSRKKPSTQSVAPSPLHSRSTTTSLDDFSKPLLDLNDMGSDDYEYTEGGYRSTDSEGSLSRPATRNWAVRRHSPRKTRRLADQQQSGRRVLRRDSLGAASPLDDSASDLPRTKPRVRKTSHASDGESAISAKRSHGERRASGHADGVDSKNAEDVPPRRRRGRPPLNRNNGSNETRKPDQSGRRSSVRDDKHIPSGRKVAYSNATHQEGTGIFIGARFIRSERLNVQDRSGRTHLFRYASRGDYEACQKLMEFGADVTIKDNAGWTALHEACLEGHVSIVSLLLQFGADPNVTAENSDTPLHDAVQRGHKEVVECLLLHGASIDAENTENETPLSVADETMQKVIQDWLQAAEEVLERDQYGKTRLHQASERGDLNELRRCLKYGADLQYRDDAGWTSLHEAALNGHYDCVRDLLLHGADVDSRGHDEDTPLYEAVWNKHHNVVKLLLQYGADVRKRNAKGKCPLDFAETADPGMKEMLLAPPQNWKPYKKPSFCPSTEQRRLAQAMLAHNTSTIRRASVAGSGMESCADPGDRQSSPGTKDSSPKRPSVSQKNEYFRTGGLPPATSEFVSERERKKFEALMAMLEKESGPNAGTGGEVRPRQSESSRTESRVTELRSKSEKPSQSERRGSGVGKSNNTAKGAKSNRIGRPPKNKKKGEEESTAEEDGAGKEEASRKSEQSTPIDKLPSDLAMKRRASPAQDDMDIDTKPSTDTRRASAEIRDTPQAHANDRSKDKRRRSNSDSAGGSAERPRSKARKEVATASASRKASVAEASSEKKAGGGKKSTKRTSNTSGVAGRSATKPIPERIKTTREMSEPPKMDDGDDDIRRMHSVSLQRRRMSKEESRSPIKARTSPFEETESIPAKRSVPRSPRSRPVASPTSTRGESPPLKKFKGTDKVLVNGQVTSKMERDESPAGPVRCDSSSSSLQRALGSANADAGDASASVKRKVSTLSGLTGYQKARPAGSVSTEKSISAASVQESKPAPVAPVTATTVTQSVVKSETATENAPHRDPVPPDALPRVFEKSYVRYEATVDPVKEAAQQESRLRRCLPLYAITLPPDADSTAASSSSPERWVLDFQLGLLFGYRTGREWTDRHPELHRRVAVHAEKLQLQRTALAETIFESMIHVRPEAERWARTVKRKSGRKALRLSQYDLCFLRVDDIKSLVEADVMQREVAEISGLGWDLKNTVEDEE